MTKIFKYDVPIDGFVELPKGAKVLYVGNQEDQIKMWVAVDPEEDEMFPRRFITVGTGHEFDFHYNVIFKGTVMIGPFVWHVFEDTR